MSCVYPSLRNLGSDFVLVGLALRLLDDYMITSGTPSSISGEFVGTRRSLRGVDALYRETYEPMGHIYGGTANGSHERRVATAMSVPFMPPIEDSDELTRILRHPRKRMGDRRRLLTRGQGFRIGRRIPQDR